MDQVPEAHAPAQAYYVMDHLMPEAYFLRPPPAQGVQIILAGVEDDVPTTWQLSELQASWLDTVLRGHPVRVLSWLSYNART